MRILVVEDEKKIADFIRKGLTENTYAVDVASGAFEAVKFFRDNDYDLILLDVMLPDGNGLALAQSFRAEEYSGPILMLTALSSTQDKVKGLDSGADDYLVKPFSFEELLARIRALLRRHKQTTQQAVLKYEDVELNLVKRIALRDGQEIPLTNKEMSLLEYFMRNIDRVITRSELIEHVWDMSFDPGSNVVDVYINMLRKKVDSQFTTKLIHTVVGQGYVMRAKNA